jgi:GNAT superfamily N-acetyltransferase
MTEIVLRRAQLVAPEAIALVRALDAELLALYPDEGEGFFDLRGEEVEAPRGAFFVAYQGEVAVACGAVRSIDASTAEVKRMYVSRDARGLGLGRRLLRTLEAAARDLGKSRIVLETGTRQPEAVALYRSEGYDDVPRFGSYPDSPLSLWLGKRL